MKRLLLSLYAILIGSTVFLGLVIMPSLESLLTDQALALTRDLTKGTFHMITKDLSQIDQILWQDHITQLQESYGYPVGIEPIADYTFTEEQLEDLYNGKIVGAWEDETTCLRLFDTELLLFMGPFPKLQHQGIINAILWCIIALFFAIPLFAWTAFLWKDIQHIRLTATSLGEGDFTARARVSLSSLKVLATTFNKMADRIEQLISSNKSLTNAVSHELRTPIARIKFALSMIDNETDASQLEEFLCGLTQDVDALETLVDELLVYARFERQAIRVSMEQRDIVGWVDELVRSISQKHEHSDIAVSFKPMLRRLDVHFDPHHLERALNNLIRNAQRFANNTIEVSIHEDPTGYHIDIDDDGVGIPNEKRDAVFEPFVRLETSRNKETGGHGLGLAIVKQIVDYHKGSVSVAESPLGGAQFTLSFPKTIIAS